MKNLEKESKVFEEQIKKSRKNFGNIGLALHFIGEGIGPMVSMIGGVIIPTIKYHQAGVDWKYLLGGAGFYIVLNGAAFVMKGISLTEDENKWFYEEWKEGHFLDRTLAKFHKHYSERDEKNIKILEKYSQLFRRS